jgi:hypothetical protein
MPKNENTDTPLPRPKKKKKLKRKPPSGRLRLALLVGGGVGGLLVVGLVIWGLVSLFGGGGAVVAKARPAEKKAPIDAFRLDQVPAAAAGWKVTPDGLPLTSGLASAVPLPGGNVLAVLFADPARATAAVLSAGPGVPARGSARTRVGAAEPAGPGVWTQVDLKAGRVVGRTPVEGVRTGTTSLVPEVANAALSPSGERLAVAFPRQGVLLEVWDRAGKKILESKETGPRRPPRNQLPPPSPAGEWVGFLSEDRVLVLASDQLVTVEVPTGAVAYTVAGVKAPVALSPGRKWVCAATATDGLKFFHTPDGSAAGEIPKFATPRAAAFSPDGTSLAVTYEAVVVWDVATGKPSWGATIPRTTVYEGFADSVSWYGRNVLARGFLFDPEQKLAVCEYDCRRRTVARAGGPDGRLWAAGSYQEELKPVPGSSKKVTPGPIADAGARGTQLLTAFTIPHADARRITEAAEKGIVFRADEPLRIEVVGKGKDAVKQLVAEAAAEAVAQRGKAVDPGAKVGVRIELSALKKVKIARGTPPPNLIVPIQGKDVRDGYEIEARTYLLNSENGIVSKTALGQTAHVPADEPDWEGKLFKWIGKRVGTENVPLAGYYDSEGSNAVLSQPAPLGIDGVLEIPANRLPGR